MRYEEGVEFGWLGNLWNRNGWEWVGIRMDE